MVLPAPFFPPIIVTRLEASSDEKLIELKKDLANTKLSYLKLADKYNISKRQILRINYGLSRANINEKYPIRKKANINGKLSDADVKVIIELLKHTYFFNGEIARMFNVEVQSILDINNLVDTAKAIWCFLLMKMFLLATC